jgi:C-terminal processing protease CtpA/Prc
MTLTLNPLEKVSLRAFLIALAKQPSPLPSTLQQEINQAGTTFATNPSAAVNHLLQLAETDTFKEAYHQARQEIQKQYEYQERIKNNSRNIESTPPDALENVESVISVLKDPDPQQAAEKINFLLVAPSPEMLIVPSPDSPLH